MVIYISVNDNQPEKLTQPPNINALHDAYQNWLKIFPFELTYFSHLKGFFQNRRPFFHKAHQVNRHSGIAYSKMLSENELVDFLFAQTRILLDSINCITLYNEGKITETQKLRIELLNQKHKIAQNALLNDYSKGERKYIKTIKAWLKNEQRYFKEMVEIENSKTPQPPPKEPTKAEKLQEAICKYGFDTLPKVKALNESQKQNLINKIAENDLPYQVAMLNYLDYFKCLIGNHFSSMMKVYKTFAEILNGNKRGIQGNVSVLNEYSKEDRTRYTAHRYKEIVEKDYKYIRGKWYRV